MNTSQEEFIDRVCQRGEQWPHLLPHFLPYLRDIDETALGENHRTKLRRVRSQALQWERLPWLMMDDLMSEQTLAGAIEVQTKAPGVEYTRDLIATAWHFYHMRPDLLRVFRGALQGVVDTDMPEVSREMLEGLLAIE